MANSKYNSIFVSHKEEIKLWLTNPEGSVDLSSDLKTASINEKTGLPRKNFTSKGRTVKAADGTYTAVSDAMAHGKAFADILSLMKVETVFEFAEDGKLYHKAPASEPTHKVMTAEEAVAALLA